MAQGCVREGLERLVQRRQLVRDPDQSLGRLEAPVERVHLVAEAIQSLEDRIQLPVIELLVHCD